MTRGMRAIGAIVVAAAISGLIEWVRQPDLAVSTHVGEHLMRADSRIELCRDAERRSDRPLPLDERRHPPSPKH